MSLMAQVCLILTWHSSVLAGPDFSAYPRLHYPELFKHGLLIQLNNYVAIYMPAAFSFPLMISMCFWTLFITPIPHPSFQIPHAPRLSAGLFLFPVLNDYFSDRIMQFGCKILVLSMHITYK